MAEPIVIELRATGPAFDGASAIPITRDDFKVTNQRLYQADIPSGGVIPADFFGLLNAAQVKLVAVASRQFNPKSVARVTSADASPDLYREEIDLSPRFQSVFMSSNDVLRIRMVPPNPATGDRNIVTLVVNAMSENEALEYARNRLRPDNAHRRFRIIRTDNSAFAATPNAHINPNFTYLDTTKTFEVETTTQGYISLRDLTNPGADGVYAWVRFTGIAGGTGEVLQVDARTEET
ncbi:MAG: hypothetical protein KC468_25645, partial [Myxococcales bacterium]|nr:hypothetical protein [Myxococcales bacterium]